MPSSKKGNKVELATFFNWGKDAIIGCKIEMIGEKKMVNFIWCKVCERYKQQKTIRESHIVTQ